MRPKTANDSSFKDYSKGYPGPGTYDMSTGARGKSGFSYVSKFKSPAGIVISRTGKRFDDSRERISMEIPAPNMYNPKL